MRGAGGEQQQGLLVPARHARLPALAFQEGGAGLGSRLLLQVHDELVVEVAPGEGEQVAAMIRDAMGSAASLSVPLEVSIGVGRTWQDAGH